ncbi:MAG TPA: DUF4190 domain-containing protein [Microbacteriaceae bacterium]|nr:DUF4190 domain-containing protein [Microbacteriaceae bacterium]
MTDPNAPQQPAYQQPAYQQGQQPLQPAPGDYPGKTLGIVGLVFAFVFALVGLILSIVALNQSKAAGYQNTPAKVGLIVSIIVLAIYVVWIIVAVVIGATALATLGSLSTYTTG